MTKVKVLDKMPGAGKSTWAYQYMRENDGPWIYASPYLSEVGDGGRVCTELSDKGFIAPSDKGQTKSEHLSQLLSNGENVAITHSLLNRLDHYMLRQILFRGYKMIIDETLESISKFNSKDVTLEDVKIMLQEGFLSKAEDKSGRLIWEQNKPCFSTHKEIKEMCDKEELYVFGNDILIKRANIKAISSCEECIVMTHNFKASIMYYWFCITHTEWDYLDVEMMFSDEELRANLRKNIIFVEPSRRVKDVFSKKDPHYAFSATHYTKMNDEDKAAIRSCCEYPLKNFNKYGIGSYKPLWTVFVSQADDIKGKGFTGARYEDSDSFAAKNTKASNHYGDRNICMYLVNVFPHLTITKYLEHFPEVEEVDVDAYALEEMLQFVMRGAVRNNKPMVLLVLSPRMRVLFEQFLIYGTKVPSSSINR